MTSTNAPRHTQARSNSWWFLLPCVIGALGLFLGRKAGDGTTGFYALTFLTALVYAVGWWIWGSRTAFSGPGAAREVLRGVLIGAVLAVIFVLGAAVVQFIPFLAGPVEELLQTTTHGGLAPTLFVLVINGIGEELVYRDMVPHQLRLKSVGSEVAVGAWSLVAYCLATIAMGVPLLIFAAAVLGAVAFYEASRSRRLYSPIAVHLTWSITMLFVMPLFF